MIRLRVDKSSGRVWGVGSAASLEPAFRRGLGLGVRCKVLSTGSGSINTTL